MYVALTSGDPLLIDEYSQCVEKLKDFRNVHLQVVTRLVVFTRGGEGVTVNCKKSFLKHAIHTSQA